MAREEIPEIANETQLRKLFTAALKDFVEAAKEDGDDIQLTAKDRSAIVQELVEVFGGPINGIVSGGLLFALSTDAEEDEEADGGEGEDDDGEDEDDADDADD